MAVLGRKANFCLDSKLNYLQSILKCAAAIQKIFNVIRNMAVHREMKHLSLCGPITNQRMNKINHAGEYWMETKQCSTV